MRLVKTKDYTELSKKAGNLIAAQVLIKPNCILGFATGSTPIGTYQELVRLNKEGDISFRNVKTFNLDEYKGLTPDDPQSYRYFMNTNLFDHVDIDKSNTHVPDGTLEDSEKACSDYDRMMEAAGGIDLQLLGIGHNGHIGFNEPSDVFSQGTNCVTLTESTIEANQRFFASAADVPRQAYTMGIKNILQARKILVVVNGTDKAEILKKVVCGNITPAVPASILKLHGDVTIIADAEACSKL